MATAERPLRRGEWIALAALGVPTFAFALAITTVSTYLPVLASSFAASTIVIGALIGGEGLMALALPVLVGSWSDRLATVTALAAGGVLLSLGKPVPFVAGPVVVAASVGAFGWVVVRRGVPGQQRRDEAATRTPVRELVALLREQGELRSFLAANALWELSLAALARRSSLGPRRSSSWSPRRSAASWATGSGARR
jgi:MFS family permease